MAAIFNLLPLEPSVQYIPTKSHPRDSCRFSTSLRCSCAASSLLPLEIEKKAEIGGGHGFCHSREIFSIFQFCTSCLALETRANSCVFSCSRCLIVEFLELELKLDLAANSSLSLSTSSIQAFLIAWFSLNFRIFSAQLLQSFSNLILGGGIEVSISIAWLGDPLNAPKTSSRALFYRDQYLASRQSLDLLFHQHCILQSAIVVTQAIQGCRRAYRDRPLYILPSLLIK